MPAIAVSEIFEERTGEWGTSEGRNFVRCFLVETNSLLDGPNVAIGSVGINRGDAYTPPGNQFEWDLNSYANRLSATLQDPLWWRVTIEYGPYSSLFAGGGPTQNPLLMPIDVSWSVSAHEYPADVDINGNAILNTAGDPYDPPLVEEEKRHILTVVRNEASYDPSLDQVYENAINSDDFAGYAPTYAKVIQIVPKSVFHQDVGWYYQRTYEFEFLNPNLPVNKNGYRRTVLNIGMRALSSVTNKKFHPSFGGIPITEPVLLSQSGAVNLNSNPPFYNIYQLKPELPFSVFNFDQSVLIGQRTGFSYGFGNQGG